TSGQARYTLFCGSRDQAWPGWPATSGSFQTFLKIHASCFLEGFSGKFFDQMPGKKAKLKATPTIAVFYGDDPRPKWYVEPCPDCSGEGKTHKGTCRKCGGTGSMRVDTH